MSIVEVASRLVSMTPLIPNDMLVVAWILHSAWMDRLTVMLLWTVAATAKRAVSGDRYAHAIASPRHTRDVSCRRDRRPSPMHHLRIYPDRYLPMLRLLLD